MTEKKNNREKNLEKAKEKAERLRLPYKDLAGVKIPVDVLKKIPREAARFYKFIPLAQDGHILEVGMVNPDDLKAREALKFIALRNKLEPKIYVISETDFKEALKQYETLKTEVEKALKELERELERKKIEEIQEVSEEGVSGVIAEAPITKIVAVILRHAIEGRASDIHIEPTERETRVRFRVDGILHSSLFLPKNVHPGIVARIKILSNLKIDESRVPQDGRFHAVIDQRKIDFRVSTLPTINGEKVVLRVLDPASALKDFPELGLQGYNLALLEKTIKKPYGMILMTGPTGSGKTTTLYTILRRLNKEAVNIISLEDPVEYYLEGINQSQIRPEINYTFASGLRHVLRQDPDVIMVGEIRDEETAGLAIHAALTGHIVLSTLHTNNAVGVIPRLIDMGIASFLLPPSLNLSVAQRLVPRLCVHCRKEILAPPAISKIIEEELEKLPPERKKEVSFKKPYKIYQAPGCKFCGGKGSKGRIAIFEMIEMTPQLEKIIIENPTETAIEEEGKRQGMITMKQDGILKVLQGLVSFEEMMKVVEE